MKKIVFVNPPLTQEERFGDFASAGNIMPPLGLCYLAAVTREKYFTEILDAPAEGWGPAKCAAEILSKEFDYVGITMTTLSVYNAHALATHLKEKNPYIKIIVGGPHITSTAKESFEKLENFDFGVLGEGEPVILNLLHALDNNAPLENIPGVVFRRDKDIIINQRPAFVKNIDEIPLPAWDLLPPLKEKYKQLNYTFQLLPTASMITSRGCPFKCRFCDTSVFGTSARLHTVDYIMKMIDELYGKYGIRDLVIYDDTFSLKKSRLIEFCKRLTGRYKGLFWICNAKIGSLDFETLTFMKKAGCREIGYGIESADEEILKYINKGINLIEVKEQVRLTKQAGISPKGYFIFGFPQETLQTMQKTIDFVLNLELDTFQVNFFTPFPGCDLHREVCTRGSFENDWKKMNLLNIVYVPEALTKRELKRGAFKARRRFYLRPHIIWNHVKYMRKPSDFINLYKAAYAFIKANTKEKISNTNYFSLRNFSL